MEKNRGIQIIQNFLTKMIKPLASYLKEKLPLLSNSPESLDLAALLWVMDENWKELNLSWEARNFVKEMQTVRNRWAHLAANAKISWEDVYRNLDTMQRFAKVVEADESLIQEIRETKISVLPKGKLEKEIAVLRKKLKNLEKRNEEYKKRIEQQHAQLEILGERRSTLIAENERLKKSLKETAEGQNMETSRKQPNSVRGRVRQKWRNDGKPKWNIEKTIEICEEIDDELRSEGFNPAKEFRRARERGDRVYIRQWVQGCRFEWLS